MHTDTEQAILERLDRLEELINRLLADRPAAEPLEYFTMEEAARITALCAETLRRAIKQGRLPAYNVTGSRRPSWRISRTDLEAFVRSGASVPDDATH